MIHHHPPSINHDEDPISKYQSMVQQNQIQFDSKQFETVQHLNHLFHQLISQAQAQQSLSNTSPNDEKFAHRTTRRGLYMYGGVGIGKTSLMNMFYQCCVEHNQKQAAATGGVVVVGENAEVQRQLLSIQRTHFHSFMLNVHSRMHQWRLATKKNKRHDDNGNVSGSSSSSSDKASSSGYAIPDIAHAIASESTILCFDEYHVNDVADAMILKQLFSILFERGCTVIATSNVPPDDLYKNGINRSLFLPFIQVLKDHCSVVNMNEHVDSESDMGGTGKDYRTLKTPMDHIYLSPNNEQNRLRVEGMFEQISAIEGVYERNIVVQYHGFREIQVPKSSRTACMFDFGDLCDRELGSIDYLGLAKQYRTIFIQNVPQFYIHVNNRKQNMDRFIILIDILYENNVVVIMTAEAPAAELFCVSDEGVDSVVQMIGGDCKSQEVLSSVSPLPTAPSYIKDARSSDTEWSTSGRLDASLAAHKNTSFAFRRTVSRLLEMQSKEYVEANCSLTQKIFAQQ